MTDHPEAASHEEALLLDALDGDSEAAATIAADPRLAARLEQMASHREALRQAAPPIDVSQRDAAIAAAMVVYDDIHASRTTPDALNSRPRTFWLLRGAGVLAASAAAAIGIIAVGPGIGTGAGDNSVAVATAEAPAESQGDTGVAGEAESSAASASPAPPAAELPQVLTTIAPSLERSTTTALAFESGADDAAEADAPPDGATSDEEGATPGPVDETLLSCAERAGIDTTAWVSASLNPTSTQESPQLQSIVVILADGTIIDIEYVPDTCTFAEISEPHAPEADDQ